jgi:hypothetical protein
MMRSRRSKALSNSAPRDVGRSGSQTASARSPRARRAGPAFARFAVSRETEIKSTAYGLIRAIGENLARRAAAVEAAAGRRVFAPGAAGVDLTVVGMGRSLTSRIPAARRASIAGRGAGGSRIGRRGGRGAGRGGSADNRDHKGGPEVWDNFDLFPPQVADLLGSHG